MPPDQVDVNIHPMKTEVRFIDEWRVFSVLKAGIRDSLGSILDTIPNFNNPVFIYIKPTIINVLFGLALIFGRYFTNEPVLKKLMGKSISLTNEGWEILNKRWIYFFFGLAILNEFVWRTQSEEFWVNFKVWGLLPITFIFTGFQIGLINKYKTNEQ